jgi:hypothetical protein
MGVRKFRSVADMPGPPPRTPLDPENLRLAVQLMELARRLGRYSLPPGTRRFHSVEEARAHRRARELAERRKVRSAALPAKSG